MIRMDYEKFKHVLNLIEIYITPEATVGENKTVTAPKSLLLTLQFLATGETFKSSSLPFRTFIMLYQITVKGVCQASVKIK